MDKEKERALIEQLHKGSSKETPKEEAEKTPKEEINAEKEEVETPEAPQESQQEKESDDKDSSLTDSNEKSETTPTETETLKDQQPTDWEELAKENGYLAPSDLEDRYYNLEEDPYIAKLIELRKSGIDIEDTEFLAEQNVDYSNYDVENAKQALELITKELKVTNPDAKEDEIRYLVEKEYGALYESEPQQGEDELDSEYQIRLNTWNKRRKDAEIESRFQARKAQKALMDRQEKMRLPKNQPQPQFTQEQIEAHKSQIASDLKGALNDFEKVNVKVGDHDYTFDVPSETKKLLSKELLDNVIYENKAFAKYVNPDQTISYAKLGEDYLWFNPETRQQMLSAYIQQAQSGTEEKVAKSLKNAELPTKKAKPTESGKPKLEGADLLAYQIAQRRRANN